MAGIYFLGEIFVRYLNILLVIIVLSVASTASAGYRELFEKEFLSKPWSTEIVADSACVECHTSDTMNSELKTIPQDWMLSWHYQNDVSCHDCHGGDSNDASMAMSHQRSFGGTPEYTEVPAFCGKCHVGILDHYQNSGHGKALIETGEGPNCVTCHGSHNIQKAGIDIINPQLCSKCHSYERAKEMKQALFLTDSKIEKLEGDLKKLKEKGVYPEKENRTLFDTQAKFRTLFHTIDAELVKDKTDFFMKRLSRIEKDIQNTFKDLDRRQKYSAMLMFIFLGLWIVSTIISKSSDED